MNDRKKPTKEEIKKSKRIFIVVNLVLLSGIMWGLGPSMLGWTYSKLQFVVGAISLPLFGMLWGAVFETLKWPYHPRSLGSETEQKEDEK